MIIRDDSSQSPTRAAPPLREVILCVDDEASVLSVLKEQLEDGFGDTCEVEAAASGDEALELISGLDQQLETLAVVVVDQIMPGMTGTELLERIAVQSPGAFKIMLTGQAGLDAVVHAINRAGLNQYIAKPWDEHDLRLVVAGMLDRFRLSQENARLLEDLRRKNAELERLNASLEDQVLQRTRELEDANARLSKLAVTDGLTGLYNHRYFHEQLARETERSQRTGEPVTLLMIDVDHFKAYNDTHGHQAGDTVLRQLASILGTGRRVNDVVARYGGEEFAVLLSGTDKHSGSLVAEYLRRRVADTRFAGEESQPGGRLTISIGVGTSPDDADNPTGLVQCADEAMYRAKAAGRNAVAQAGSVSSEGAEG
ncbi:MAG: diguanylate cyclase [bacterium]